MKIGYTIWTWGLESEQDFLSALQDLKKNNYQHFENFIGIADLYEGKIDEFKKVLRDYDIEFVAIYNYIEDLAADNLATARKYLDFCRKTGAKIMNIQAPPRAVKPTEANLSLLANNLNAIGEEALKYGVTLCLHPHFETIVETQVEIDFIAEHTSPACVSFCFDTAHTVLGGMDPAHLVSEYSNRIGYMHLKDINPDVDIEKYRHEWQTNFENMQRFFELGTKGIDFPKVVHRLTESGYEGFYVVEVDTPTVSNFEAARTSMDYLYKEFLLN